jgi:hypothetical protein
MPCQRCLKELERAMRFERLFLPSLAKSNARTSRTRNLTLGDLLLVLPFEKLPPAKVTAYGFDRGYTDRTLALVKKERWA